MSKNKITLLDGKQYDVDDLLDKMVDDDFYYGFCGKTMLSSSTIKNILDGSFFQAETQLSKQTKDAYNIGRLYHMGLLERDKLEDNAIIADCKTRAGKEYKQLISEHGEDWVYTKTQWQKMVDIIDKVKENHQELLHDHVHCEMPAITMLKGIPFRGKADMISFEKQTIVDLKTTSRLSHFEESAVNYDYDIQLYIYCNMFGIKPTSFYWLALEKRTGDTEYFVGSDALYYSGKQKTEQAIEMFINKVDE